MIVLSPQTVLERIADIVERVVLPDLQSGYARGQAHAAIALLKDVVLQWHEFTGIYLADNRGLVRLLRRFLALAGTEGNAAMGGRTLCARMKETLGHVQLRTASYQVARADNLALRALADEMLVALDGRPEDRQARSLRRALRKHLKAQLLRELRVESQDALGRMSRGE